MAYNKLVCIKLTKCTYSRYESCLLTLTLNVDLERTGRPPSSILPETKPIARGDHAISPTPGTTDSFINLDGDTDSEE